MGNFKVLRVLAIMALASFIICSVFWLVERPNRYQIVISGGTPIRLDTLTGTACILIPARTAAGNIEYVTPDMIARKKQ
jgi:hypothetical protein